MTATSSFCACALAVVVCLPAELGVLRQGHHAHKAPRGGVLVELGEEEAHLELVLERATGTLTLYVLDAEAERAVRTADREVAVAVQVPGQTPVNLTLVAVANVLTGESAGNTSQFAGAHPALRRAGRLQGTVRSVTVRGRRYLAVAFTLP